LIALTCIATFSASALAQAPARPGDVLNLAGQHLRQAYHPAIEYHQVSKDGRHLQIFEAGASWSQVVAFYKDAYARSLILSGGLIVGGYFVNADGGYATVTLYRGKKRCVLRMTDSIDGTVFSLWRSHRSHR
jgi:hypothetical protein